MPFPAKFKSLLETELSDVDRPDYAWLTYAVCATTTKACGWGGWILEAVFREVDPPAAAFDGLLPADTRCKCPRCGRKLFRTSASLRFDRSSDQRHVHGEPGIDYRVVPMEYE